MEPSVLDLRCRYYPPLLQLFGRIVASQTKPKLPNSTFPLALDACKAFVSEPESGLPDVVITAS